MFSGENVSWGTFTGSRKLLVEQGLLKKRFNGGKVQWKKYLMEEIFNEGKV